MKINSIELKLAKEEENEEQNKKSINDELKKALKEIEFLKNKINENEKNLNVYIGKVKILEEEKNKKSEKEEENNNFENLSINDLINKKDEKNNIYLRDNFPYSNRLKSIQNLEDKNKKKFKIVIANNRFDKKYSRNEPIRKVLKRNLTETDFKLPHRFSFSKIISPNIFYKNGYNNRACIFSQNDIIYIIYGVLSLDLECYDCSTDNKFILFKKLHKEPFDSCRYFYDKNKFRDLIITSSHDSHVKVINFKLKDSTVILDLDLEIYKDVIINTAYFIDNKIIVPFAYHYSEGNISFYNLGGLKIKQLKEDPGFVLCINGYYHENTETKYAIVSNTESICVYNIDDYSLYYIISFLQKFM